jgi:ATP-dependent exoDNAse (exonuclease V) beta subunit
MVKRISTRQIKNWQPTTNKGAVFWHYDIMDVDLRTGEWLILARTNYIANKVANKIKDSGYLYWREGSGWSISPNVLNGIEVWLKLCKNQKLPISEWKNFSKITQPHVFTKHGRKALTSLDPEKLYSIDHMGDCLNVSAETHWDQVVKVSSKELTYIRSVRRSGEKILSQKNPRIKISTIHKAKGGEADNVLLLLESSRACLDSIDQDSEIRTFYVGATRAKKQLHIVETNKDNGFRL